MFEKRKTYLFWCLHNTETAERVLFKPSPNNFQFFWVEIKHEQI